MKIRYALILIINIYMMSYLNAQLPKVPPFQNGLSLLSAAQNNQKVAGMGELIVNRTFGEKIVLTNGFVQTFPESRQLSEASVLLRSYPNPASSQVQIEWNDPYRFHQFQLMNSLGEIIVTGSIQATNQFHISVIDLDSGIYYVQLFNTRNHPLQTIKLLKI